MGISSASRILIVDEDVRHREYLSTGLERVGFQTVCSSSGIEALARIADTDLDAVVTDVQMPEIDGFDVLRSATARTDRLPVIILTGFASVQHAVEAMKLGAADFIEKPVGIEELGRSLNAALTAPPAQRRESKNSFLPVATWDDTMLAVMNRIAGTDTTVLIQGETGTGKTMLARHIWRSSARAEAPFVEVNCTSIPEHLLESELFGHVRGAFTGAVSSQTGKVELAEGGTLFLDEVGELKPALQAKLLQLLQDRVYEPVGAKRPRHANVRFIAATNKDLLAEIAAGRFRADLYYRLNVVSLAMPPLRERRSEIPRLIERFRDNVASRLGVAVPRPNAAAMRHLHAYHWPGNIRELQNMIERLGVIHAGMPEVGPECLGLHTRGNGTAAGTAPLRTSPSLEHDEHATEFVRSPGRSAAGPHVAPEPEDEPGPADFAAAVRNYERTLIQSAMTRAKGNKSEAARVLNLKRTTLLEKLKRLDIACE